MKIKNENGKIIDTSSVERKEQELVKKYILPDDIVLELGARYGSVSCTINLKLQNKNNQIVVEPDERTWKALEENKIENNCEFKIIKGFISKKKMKLVNLDRHLNGYGSTSKKDANSTIPHFELDDLINKYNLIFNVLVADCEGCLELFLDENPRLFRELRLIIFEADYPKKCNYKKIKNILLNKNFKKILEGHQNVWIKRDDIINFIQIKENPPVNKY